MQYKNIINLVILILFIVSCEKIENTYSEFVKDGEIIYVSKADSLSAHGGKNRVQLVWMLPTDPKLRSYKVFWNDGRDSLEGLIQNRNEMDTMDVIIDSLEEDSFIFEVYMYGNHGNSSLKSTVIGNSFGDDYERSLLTRTYKNIKILNDSTVVIDWNPPETNEIGIEVKYLDTDNDTSTVFISNTSFLDTLRNIQVDEYAKFSYRSAFIPEKNALDTFYSEHSLVKEFYSREVKLDKKKWSKYFLDNDGISPATRVYSGRPIDRAWDGSTSTSPCRFAFSELPQWFTLDLGDDFLLTRIKMDFYSGDGVDPKYLYRLVPKEFEVWGSNNPSQSGDWSDWVQLGHFIGAVPSGKSPGGDNSQLTFEDIETAKDGLIYSFDTTGGYGYYKYIRIKVLSSWDGDSDVWFSEITLWGEEE